MTLVREADRGRNFRQRGVLGAGGEQSVRAVHADFDEILMRGHAERFFEYPRQDEMG